MLPEKMVKARLSFLPGKNVHQPNLVIVPDGAKSFSISVEWTMESPESYVVSSPHGGCCNLWCVLDADLKQVIHGSGKPGRKGPKHAESIVGRMIQGGGAHNPEQIDLELQSAKLKNGGRYTLIASHHGILAAGEFVAVHQPKPKAAKKAVKKPAAKKKATKKKATKKKAA